MLKVAVLVDDMDVAGGNGFVKRVGGGAEGERGLGYYGSVLFGDEASAKVGLRSGPSYGGIAGWRTAELWCR